MGCRAEAVALSSAWGGRGGRARWRPEGRCIGLGQKRPRRRRRGAALLGDAGARRAVSGGRLYRVCCAAGGCARRAPACLACSLVGPGVCPTPAAGPGARREEVAAAAPLGGSAVAEYPAG